MGSMQLLMIILSRVLDFSFVDSNIMLGSWSYLGTSGFPSLQGSLERRKQGQTGVHRDPGQSGWQ